MDDFGALADLGLTPSAVRVYIALVDSGPASIRNIAENTGINRGSVHVACKQLCEAELVTQNAQQTYQAKHPQAVWRLAEKRRRSAHDTADRIRAVMPKLLAHADASFGHTRYTGAAEITLFLDDILRTVSAQVEMRYRAYATRDMCERLCKVYPAFADRRRALGIEALIIGMGDHDMSKPAAGWRYMGPTAMDVNCEIIFADKVAYVAETFDNSLEAVVAIDNRVAALHRVIFDRLWENLPTKPF